MRRTIDYYSDPAVACCSAAKSLWPFEKNWPAWDIDRLFALWAAHRDHLTNGAPKPPKPDTDEYCRHLMLTTALWLSRRDRIKSMDRCGGADDFAMETVSFLFEKTPDFHFDKGDACPKLLLKSLFTSIFRRFVDRIDAAQGEAVNISTIASADDDDVVSRVASNAAPPVNPQKRLLARLLEPEVIAEGIRDAIDPEAAEALWKFQAEQLANHGTLVRIEKVPIAVTSEDHALVTVRLNKLARLELESMAA